MTTTDKEALEKYIVLISKFVFNLISASNFEAVYLEIFKKESHSFKPEIFQILDELFGDVDTFCSDANLRDEDDIDEDQLRANARSALSRLDKL